MPLSSVPYMRWAKWHAAEGEFPLTMSAVPAIDWAELGLDPRDLQLYEYSPYGFDDLLEAIGHRWGREGDEVLLASSTTHAHFCFAASSVAVGDRILYESPGYTPLIDSLSLLQVEAIRFERRFEDAYALPRDRIDTIVEMAQPSLLLLTNLHNPSGVALSEDDANYLVDLCDRTGMQVLCDEIYRAFLDPDPGPLALRHPNIVSVWGLNKVHGIPLIRVGWGLASKTRVQRARQRVDSTTVHNSTLSDQVARFALPEMPRLEARARKIAAAGWSVARPWLERSPFDVVLPETGLTAFPRIPDGLFEDSDELREALLEVGVGITPGRFFEAPMHFRMGVGLPAADMEEALRRVDRVLAGRKGKKKEEPAEKTGSRGKGGSREE